MVWKKVLYEKQPYEDNYVEPEQFLDGLKKNLYTKTYSLVELVLSAVVVSIQLTCVCLFVGVYWYIQEGWLHPLTLFTASTTVTALAFTMTTIVAPLHPLPSVTGFLRDKFVPSLLVVLFLSAVSPILRTLTETVSTDTIWAMTVGMLGAHLAFHNYGTQQELATSAISLNAAIFGSVCLASRLPSTLGAFVIVVFAIQLFALVPKLRARLKMTSPRYNLCLLAVLVGISLPVLYTVSLTAAMFHLLSLLAVTFLGPLWYHQLQHLKNTIHGPWDEAVLHS